MQKLIGIYIKVLISLIVILLPLVLVTDTFGWTVACFWFYSSFILTAAQLVGLGVIGFLRLIWGK